MNKTAILSASVGVTSFTVRLLFQVSSCNDGTADYGWQRVFTPKTPFSRRTLYIFMIGRFQVVATKSTGGRAPTRPSVRVRRRVRASRAAAPSSDAAATVAAPSTRRPRPTPGETFSLTAAAFP